jgi:aspartate aminotransferase-like enzyme
VVSGLYGRAFGQLAARFARDVIEVETADNASIAPAAVGDALARNGNVTIVAVVHCETPSGTMNDVDAIAEITARSGQLLIVDAVSSFAGTRTDFERSRTSTGSAPACSSSWPRARRTSSHVIDGRPARCGPARKRSG